MATNLDHHQKIFINGKDIKHRTNLHLRLRLRSMPVIALRCVNRKFMVAERKHAYCTFSNVFESELPDKAHMPDIFFEKYTPSHCSCLHACGLVMTLQEYHKISLFPTHSRHTLSELNACRACCISSALYLRHADQIRYNMGYQ